MPYGPFKLAKPCGGGAAHLEAASSAFPVHVHGARLWCVAHVAGVAARPVGVATAAAGPVAGGKHACMTVRRFQLHQKAPRPGLYGHRYQAMTQLATRASSLLAHGQGRPYTLTTLSQVHVQACLEWERHCSLRRSLPGGPCGAAAVAPRPPEGGPALSRPRPRPPPRPMPPPPPPGLDSLQRLHEFLHVHVAWRAIT